MGHRIVSDEAAVQSDRLAIEEVRQRLVGGRRVTQRARRQVDATYKIFIKFPIDSEPHPDTGTITIKETGLVLEEIFAAHADIAAKPEPPDQTLQSGHPLLLLLGIDRGVGKSCLHVRQVVIPLGDSIFILSTDHFHGGCFLLGFRGGSLGLLKLLLGLLL